MIAFWLGVATGLIVFAALLPVISRRQRTRRRDLIESYEQVILDLRHERADDRETNRRLRRELAISTPEGFQALRDERDRLVVEVRRLQSELNDAVDELAERDQSLRQARVAIHEIRVQLEGGRFEPGAAEWMKRSVLGDDIAGEGLNGGRAVEESPPPRARASDVANADESAPIR